MLELSHWQVALGCSHGLDRPGNHTSRCLRGSHGCLIFPDNRVCELAVLLL